MTTFQILFLSLVLTILIEYAVLVALRERSARILGASVVINLLTNIPLNLYVLFVSNSTAAIALGEMLVFLLEGLWYWLFLRKLSKAFIYSFLCNAISFLTGLLIQIILANLTSSHLLLTQ